MFDEKDLILDAKHVTRRFLASNNRTLVACNDVNLRLYRGKSLGLVGESGCGKSTFMRFLVSLDTPTEGEILFHGKDITRMKGEELRQNRQKIQMVFQDPSGSFNPKMKIRDIICEPLLNFGRIHKREKDAMARKYLELVDLPGEFADRYPHNMSGGQRQRIAIARAIVLEPEIIVMDEATCALDVFVRYFGDLEQSTEELAVTEVPVKLTMGEANLTIFPGYTTREDVAQSAEEELRSTDYDFALSMFSMYSMVDIFRQEGIRQGVIDCYSMTNKDLFADKTLFYVAGKYSSIIGPSFAAMYNAITGYAEEFRENGRAFQMTIYVNAYNYEDLGSVMKVYDETANFERLKELTEAWSREDALARRAE